jgi:PfaB family protein
MSIAQAVAVVAIGGEFPGANDLTQFWENISAGHNAATEPPAGRWLLSLNEAYAPEVAKADHVYSRKACFLAEETNKRAIPGLDIDPDFLEALDPMFRLLLRVGQQTLSDAKNIDFDRRRAGIIIGNLALPSEASSALARNYLGRTFCEKLSNEPLDLDQESVHPLNHFVAGLPAGLLAKALAFNGRCFTLDAACASSLYAVQLAAEELLSGRADVMLSGGLSRPDSLYTQMGFSQLRALSPDGTCSPFSNQANGLVVGEGCGLMLLKRLDDAVRDNDQIYGVIRAVGLSNDREGNLLAPSTEGQMRAMQAAYREAGWSPEDVDHIECHATGTPVGDAVELNSLHQLWQPYEGQPGRCVLGSVKANIGHLLTAAGSAALIKTLLALKHRTLPPMANFRNLPKEIDPGTSPFRVLREKADWPARQTGIPRRAAVSAFGFGGTNAHMLVEEWLPQEQNDDHTSHRSLPQRKEQPLAIVGMATHMGVCDDLTAFEHLFQEVDNASVAKTPHNWWGAEQSRWFSDQGYRSHYFSGHRLEEVTTHPGEFRIPPNEVSEMLPRQLLMLQVAAAAFGDAGMATADHLHTGVFIGCGLDLNATNFSFRWGLRALAQRWAKQLQLEQSAEEFNAWVAELRDQAGPALTANRTMGALGSTVASRIAKEFRVGGPSFTVSGEENSGLRALETAFHALQNRSINSALVGAVEFTGEFRACLCRYQLAEDKDLLPVSDGAVALVLKRLDDAKRDGDRIYAVIPSLATANSGHIERTADFTSAYEQSLTRLLRTLPTQYKIGHVELAATGKTQVEQIELPLLEKLLSSEAHLGWSAAVCGYAGGVSGLAALVKSALMLKRRVLLASESDLRNIPSVKHYNSSVAQYWLVNQGEIRSALVADNSSDGSCIQVLLSEADHAGDLLCGIEEHNEGLFLLRGKTSFELQQQIVNLKSLMAKRASSISALARRWWHLTSTFQGETCATLVAQNSSMLQHQLDFLSQRLEQKAHQEIGFAGEKQLQPALRERVFYSPQPLSQKGKLAFIFPGSGNHFAEMGSEHSAFWPQIYQLQEQENLRLADQYLASQFRRSQLLDQVHDDHNALVISHVALCTALSDLVRYFGIEPDMVSGYSLGESSGLFSTRAWRDRDAMLHRLDQSSLFVDDLAGKCKAAQATWNVPANEHIDWQLGIVNLPADDIKKALVGREQVYLLIINSYREVVIGGRRQQVEQLVADLGCHFIPLRGVTTVHCEVVNAVADAYRSLHMFEIFPPQGIDFYSCALGCKYPLTSSAAADVILAQAQDTVDYPKVIEQLYKDGARIFIETGPGNSCSRMIDSILGEREHLCIPTCVQGAPASGQILRLLARSLAQGVPVDLTALYPAENSNHQGLQKQRINKPLISLHIGASPFNVPMVKTYKKDEVTVSSDNNINPLCQPLKEPSSGPEPVATPASSSAVPLIEQYNEVLTYQVKAHEAYLNFSRDLGSAVEQSINLQMQLLGQMKTNGVAVAISEADAAQSLSRAAESPITKSESTEVVAFDRSMCLEFAIGSVAKMLGPDFAEVDTYPTRVRLPDEPLMLVDRIMTLEGEAKSLSHGRVVTEHDVSADRWYLDGGRIPTCVAVEAGQADLFLSGYLGIDFVSKGKAVYRLLDAVVTFHRSLPVVGEVIRYDIKIERFFRQDQTYLFRFNFEGTVNGEPLLSMRDGCAGFFTAEELAAGQGIVHTKFDLLPQPGKLPANWYEPVPLNAESYNDQQIDALYRGDLASCFGAPFDTLPIERPFTLPGGLLKLVDRVTSLDPHGGRYGIGQIRAEMDIDPADWFLTCHFVDDRVMPGTLMYECCMHTLRIYLLRLGWVGAEGQTWCEPVPGVASGLKCRGQVTAATRTVTYQVSIKELGYGPEPFAIVDALMYADDMPIVEIPDMSVRLAGLTKKGIESLWAKTRTTANNAAQRVLYDRDRITAFAIGDPSYAFGEKYRVFDHERKIARLPGPPFQFIDRIVAVDGEPWVLKSGTKVVAEYDVPPDAWYFDSNRQRDMPFAVLLEIGLQPCGWLAAYLGSALTSSVDLCFRNLDGNAVQLRPVTPESGTLTVKVEMTRVANSAGMIIQNYDFCVSDKFGEVYTGDTVFGFFSQASLAQQVGVRGAELYQPTASELARAQSFSYPDEAPYPLKKLRMVDRISHFDPIGGQHNLGYLRGQKQVDPDEWFFKAHFYQDPVCPGSLGLESYLQLLKVFAAKRWGATASSRFETVALQEKHSWNYRGQIVPSNKDVTIEATITAVDDDKQQLTADGLLSVDGKVIYQLNDFSLRLH